MRRVAMATALLWLAPVVHAQGFFDDSKVDLDTRLLSYNRDWRSGSGQSFGRETASLTQLRFISGFTPGPIGFGFDLAAMAALRLDSSAGHAGVLLRTDAQSNAYQFSGKILPTFKAKAANTLLEVGSVISYLPVLQYDGAVLPQAFRGARITSTDVGNLTLSAGRFIDVMNRSGVSYVPIQIGPGSPSFKTVTGNHAFDYAGGDYNAAAWRTRASYYFARFEDVYDQHYLGALNDLSLPQGSLRSDVRVFSSRDQGQAAAGRIDNFLYSVLLSYSVGAHKLSASYQKSNGGSAFPYISGTDPYLVNYQLVGTFSGKSESSWKVQYEYNFKDFGIPELTVSNLYVKGTGIATASGTGYEWERNTDVTYVFDKNGPLKNLRLKWRNGTYRTNYTRNVDENRVLLIYTLALK
ncbi:OprD family outer membrane porin [Pandoraea sp. NPDC087047]|uniref:OprD family outer membrane porin n=1 Tax=Pandoraea sp. NPDC087047 TaxID=3364390 RepID=UPI00382A898B